MDSLDVYLIRHGEAEDGGYDAYRGLTGQGRRKMRASAVLLAREAEIIDCIYTSPLVRAVQTAEITAQAVGLDDPILIVPEIATPPKLETLIALVDQTPANFRGVALVGHEPTFGALASRMIGRGVPGFQKGEVYALRYDRFRKHFSFRWRISPDGPTLVDNLDR